MKKENWSIAEIQNMRSESSWDHEKETIYATDSDKCLRGVYYSLIGEEETNPIEPDGIRRMEVGDMIERNQINKMKSMGILVAQQERVFDKEYNVSGRYDALVISPTLCSPEVKKLINRKKAINKKLKEHQGNFYKGLGQYRGGEITKKEFLLGRVKLDTLNDTLFDEDWDLNQKILADKKNPLMLVEVKSISEWGYKYRLKEKKPLESHERQTIFYFWKLLEEYSNLIARILYVQVPYQNLLEFDVKLDISIIDDLKKIWKHLNSCVKNKKLPVAASGTVQNPITGKWAINYQADWCKYHNKCTGDPKWLSKAFAEIKAKNKYVKK